MHVWDVQIKTGHTFSFIMPEGWNTNTLILSGTASFNRQAKIGEAQVVVLERVGQQMLVQAESDTQLLLLSGEPLEEPIVGYGPFVMNTQQEVNQAIEDFNEGRFGKIP